MKTKILNLILIFGFLYFIVALVSPVAHAVTPECDYGTVTYNTSACLAQGGSPAITTPTQGKSGSNSSSSTNLSQCNDPFSSSYTSSACVKQRLGVSDLKAGEILIARDPNSLIVVVAQIFIWIAIVASVLRIAWKGIQIGGAGDDADKRKELFVAIIWTLVGLMVALGALGITSAVANIVFGKSLNDQIIDCKNLPTNAELSLVNKCNEVINGTGGGSGGGILNSTPTP